MTARNPALRFRRSERATLRPFDLRPVVEGATRQPAGSGLTGSQAAAGDVLANLQRDPKVEADTDPCRLAPVAIFQNAGQQQRPMSAAMIEDDDRLLTGWSLVRIRPGEPNKTK